MVLSCSLPWTNSHKEHLLPSSLSPPGAVSENSTNEHTLGSIHPNWFLPQEKQVWPARLVLQGHEAPQVLKEREVPLVSAEPLGMPGPQVSDRRS